MSVSAAISVNQILTRVAVEAGLDSVADPFASTDAHYIQLKTLLQTACEDLCLAFMWEFLTYKFTISTQADTSAYPLPSDFMQLVSETGWNQSTDEPIVQLTPQQWRAIEASDVDPINNGFRIMGGMINIVPANMSAGIELTFEYLSRNFALLSDAEKTPSAVFSSGADIILFDRVLIIRYLKMLWLEAKGFDSASANSAFTQIFEMVTGKDKGGERLNIGRNSTGRLIGYRNIPDGNYG